MNTREITWSWNGLSEGLLNAQIWLAEKIYKLTFSTTKEAINSSPRESRVYLKDITTVQRMLHNLEVAVEDAILLIDGHLVARIIEKAEVSSTLYVGSYIKLVEADNRFFLVFRKTIG